jgi:hypothetical protein
MLYTILFSLLIIIICHILYTHMREYLTPLKTKDVYTFQNEKVSELISLLESNKKDAVVDFSAMESELANLIDGETDIKTNCDVYLDASITPL